MPRVPSPTAAHIGAQIKGARESSTMTQDQLAVRSEIDSSNVRAYEAGRAMPSIHTLVRIADALLTPPGYFIDDLALDMFPTAASDGRRKSG